MAVDDFLDWAGLEKLWPDTLDDEDVRDKLADANMLVRSKYPDLRKRIEAGLILLEDVQRVIKRMVQRACKAPQDEYAFAESQTNITGPYSTTLKFNNPNNGDVFLTKAERETLACGTSRNGRAFSTFMGGVR